MTPARGADEDGARAPPHGAGTPDLEGEEEVRTRLSGMLPSLRQLPQLGHVGHRRQVAS